MHEQCGSVATSYSPDGAALARSLIHVKGFKCGNSQFDSKPFRSPILLDWTATNHFQRIKSNREATSYLLPVLHERSCVQRFVDILQVFGRFCCNISTGLVRFGKFTELFRIFEIELLFCCVPSLLISSLIYEALHFQSLSRQNASLSTLSALPDLLFTCFVYLFPTESSSAPCCVQFKRFSNSPASFDSTRYS